MNKEIKIPNKFGLLCILLPYYSNMFNQWEYLITHISKESKHTWIKNLTAFKNLHTLMKYREVHTYKYEFDNKYFKYIKSLEKDKNIVFNIILVSDTSYKSFISFLSNSKFGRIINKIYTLNHINNMESILKICLLLQENNIPLETMSMNTYEISQFFDTEIKLEYSFTKYYNDSLIPYVHTVISNYDMINTERCENLVLSIHLYKSMIDSHVILKANKIWMQFFEVKAMLESKCEFPEMIKDSVKTFVLYNSTSKLLSFVKSKFTFIPVDHFDNLDLMLSFAIENFPKLEQFEVSRFGFSANKLIEILNTKPSKRLLVDMYELPVERNFLCAENAIFAIKTVSKKECCIHIIKADKIEIEWDEDDEKSSIFFSSFHNYAAFDKIICFRGENIKLVEDLNYSGNESVSNLLNYLECKTTQSYSCGITLNGLKQLNIKKYSPLTIVPFHCALAEICIPVNTKCQLLVQSDYFRSLQSFTPLIINFEVNEESEFDEFDDDLSVLSLLASLNVIELRLTCILNEDFISLFIRKYMKAILSWKDLRNFYTQIQNCKGIYRNPKFKSEYSVHSLLEEGNIIRTNCFCEHC